MPTEKPTLYDRFAERARKAVAYSREEAIRLGSENIGTEHLLLGIMREGNGLAIALLEKLGTNMRDLREVLEEAAGTAQTESSGVPIDFTLRAKKTLELAEEDATNRGHHYIDTEHVLMGLLRNSDCRAEVALRRANIDFIRADVELKKLLQTKITSRKPRLKPDFFKVIHRFKPVSTRSTTAEKLTRLPNSDVRPHFDHAAVRDELNRELFAEALAQHITFIHEQGKSSQHSSSYAVHIHGPWGVGKTTTLTLVRKALSENTPSDPWIVVDFNAWIHQRLDPPWWWLLRSIYVQALDQLGFGRRTIIRARSLAWRSLTMIGPIAIAGCLLIWGSIILDNFPTQGSLLRKLLGLGVLGSAIIAASRWFVFGSARAAGLFVEYTGDPLRLVSEYHRFLIDWLNKPVVVLIDDLDRCNAKYVVNLLEGLQTIFKGPPVIYVVAADREWICRSFETIYSEFADDRKRSGKSFGHHFLEKTFQLSVSVPSAGLNSLQIFWGKLLGVGIEDGKGNDSTISDDVVRQMLGELKTDEDIMRKLAETPANTLEGRVLRRLSVRKLLSSDSINRSSHLLLPFADLQDRNPRAMKRLINAFAIYRALAVTGGVEIEMDKLGLWTVLSFRWPELAGHLAVWPEHVNKASRIGMPKELEVLLERKEVLTLLAGIGGRKLDVETIKACARLTGHIG